MRLERLFCTLVQDEVERGSLTPESAAELLLWGYIPVHVIYGVLNRAQGRDVPSEWPELCEAVMPRVKPGDWTSTIFGNRRKP